MKFGVIGAGAVGGTLAQLLAKLGHEVSIANSRGPESLTTLAAGIGASPAIRRTPKQQCFASSTISASTPSMVVSWTTPGGSSPERRPTVGILTLLLSGGRSPKLTGAASPRTAPNERLRSAGRSQRKQPAAQHLDDCWESSS